MSARRLAAMVVVLAGLTSRSAGAVLELPRRSPYASVSRVVGTTEIGVDYRSPAAGGRAIWGGAVRYDEVWRGEESPAARIRFDHGVSIGGQAVTAGTYALLLVPSERAWTFVLNADSELAMTSRTPHPQSDVARASAVAEAAPYRERLAFLITDLPDEGARVDLEWGGVRVSLTIALGAQGELLAPRAPAVEEIRKAAGTRATRSPDIATVVAQHRGEIQACYQRALRRDPTLVGGKLIVSVAVGASGVVRNVSVEGTVGIHLLIPCIRSAVSRWILPASGEAYAAEIPIVLRGGQ